LTEPLNNSLDDPATIIRTCSFASFQLTSAGKVYQWRSKRGQVRVRAPGLRPWGRINTLYSAIQKRVFKQKFRSKYV